MKIIYITSSLPYGTGEAFIIPEIKGLKERGHDILIVPMYPRGIVYHNDARSLMSFVRSQPLLSLDIIKSVLVLFLHCPFKMVSVLGCLLQSCTLTIMFKNLAVYLKSLWLAYMAEKWGADHIHAHWAATTATMAMIASEVSGIPWSFTAHRWDIVENNLLAIKIKKATFSRFISQISLERAKALGIKEVQNKTFVLHMGVELPTIKSNTRQMAQLTILCSASFLPVKGHVYLIKACKILQKRDCNVKVWLAGEGPLRAELQNRVKRLGLSVMVRFLGHVSHSELLKLYSEGKVGIVVLPSIDLGNGLHEGIPVSLIEAMSYCIPVISTTTGGIPELLEGGAGILVPPKDPIALANAIEQLVKNKELREKIGQAGRRRIKESFAINKIITELVKKFEIYTRQRA